MPVQQNSYAVNASINTEVEIVASDSATLYFVRSARLSCDKAGTVVFRNGVGGTIVAQIAFKQDEPQVLGPEVWGGSGKRLSKGNGLTATLASATLVGEVVCDAEN